MKVLLVRMLTTLFVLLVPPVAAIYASNACAGAARVFFSVVPVVFVVGSAIGLLARHRA
jgi:hypothetical protein